MRQATFSAPSLLLGEVHEPIRVQLPSDSCQRPMSRKRASTRDSALRLADTGESHDLAWLDPSWMQRGGGSGSVDLAPKHGERIS